MVLGPFNPFSPLYSTVYSESTNAVTRHSPILAWVADGYPLYGPYGYTSASNSASGVRRMVSGYVLRNGQSGTSNLTVTGRGALPQWAVRLYNVASNALAGPNVSTTYPLGRYMEDNEYLGDLGHTQGVDFDLDVYNGRWCVTPEFPNGTYAYFVSVSADGTPVFPYNIGRAYYGDPSGGSVSSFTETVTTNFLGGPNTAATLGRPVISGNDVVLTWSGVEGGGYVVQAEQILTATNWPAVGSNTVGSAGVAAATETNGAAASTRFYRLLRTALADYDPVDGSGGGIVTNSLPAPGGSVSRGHGTNVTMTITLPSNPPQPPAGLVPASVTLGGTIKGTALSRPTQGTVVASFSIPGTASTGALAIVIEFNPAPTYTMTGAFTINP